MREFKFRAWDRTNKEMLFAYLDELYGGELDNCAHFTDWGNVMQFTGLKDKNGKEIYEGDIIICRDGKFVIEYIESFAKFVMTAVLTNSIENIERYSQDADTCMRSIEVIGNIYENPEGLKNEEVKE